MLAGAMQQCFNMTSISQKESYQAILVREDTMYRRLAQKGQSLRKGAGGWVIIEKLLVLTTDHRAQVMTYTQGTYSKRAVMMTTIIIMLEIILIIIITIMLKIIIYNELALDHIRSR